ncbi:MAG: DUF6020 family protein [Lachnospiraceae bacterium]|nr:DUF6020 family protein [Lachnospiraceae bacterium]
MTGKRAIITLYLSLIYVALADVFISDNPTFILITTVIFATLSYMASSYILRWTAQITISKPDPITGNAKRKAFLLSTFVCLFIMMIWFIGFKPGSFQGDCIYQLEQALTGKYTDWNPVWHTLLFYTLPLKITGGKLWSMTFFQMIWFSLAIGYTTMTIYECAGRLWALISFCHILINPYTGQMMLYPWKDSAFAITGLLISVIILKLLYSGDKWDDRLRNPILLGFLLANLSVFRHNGILYSIPLILILLLWIRKKSWIFVTISFILTTLLIKGPIYKLVNTEHTPQGVEQTVGLPMTILANVAKETPERLDPETTEFMYSIAPQEVWSNEYELGNYGVVKYWSDIDAQVIEEKGVIPIVKMALHSFTYSPAAAIKATLALTDIVYGIDLKDEGYIGTQIIPNDLGLVETGNSIIASVLSTYYKIYRLHGFNFFRQSASSLLIILIFGLSQNSFDYNGLKKLSLILPIFTYSFGTMLLLTSADSRFFYIAYITCPLLCLMEIKNRNDYQTK